MRDIYLHKWIFGLGVGMAIICMLFALAVFDFTLALALFGVALALPPIGLLSMPGERPRAGWVAALLAAIVIGFPVGILLQDQPTRERSFALINGFGQQPAISWAWLEQVYKSMPADTARHPITLPEGTTATTSTNLDLLMMLEEPEKR